MTFWKTVGAYLTGWAIAQSIFLRVLRHVRETQTEEFKDEVANYVARRLANELELRDKVVAALRHEHEVVHGVVRELEGNSHLPDRPDGWFRRLRAASDRTSTVIVTGGRARHD